MARPTTVVLAAAVLAFLIAVGALAPRIPGPLRDRIGDRHIFPMLPTAVAAFRDEQGAGDDHDARTAAES